jgi:hypothetical protein
MKCLIKLITLLAILGTVGCADIDFAKKPEPEVVVQNCTVTESVDGTAQVTCPDGTNFTFPAQVSSQPVTVVVSAPVTCTATSTNNISNNNTNTNVQIDQDMTTNNNVNINQETNTSNGKKKKKHKHTKKCKHGNKHETY